MSCDNRNKCCQAAPIIEQSFAVAVAVAVDVAVAIVIVGVVAVAVAVGVAVDNRASHVPADVVWAALENRDAGVAREEH